MNEHVEKFLENGYWKSIYDRCPNETLTKHFEQSFIFSDTKNEDEKEEAIKQMQKLEENFEPEDWQYLIDNTASNRERAEYSRMKHEAEARKK